jgi:hypothetical protein
MRPGLAEQGGELAPGGRLAGSALKDEMVDEPAFQAATPGPDGNLDAIFLHVGVGGEEQAAQRHGVDPPILAPLVEPLPIGCLAGLRPGLTQHGVDEAALRLVRRLTGFPLPGDPLPRQPADRAVQAGEVKADRQRIDRRRRRPPLALGQHLRLVMLGDRPLAGLAVIRPPFPADPSASAATRTSAAASHRSAGTARSSAAGPTPRIPARSWTAP